MLSKILTLLAMAEPQQEDEPSGLRRLIVPIIVFSLYILSSLFKGKGGKKPKEPQIPRQHEQQPAKRTKPLPSYARKTQSAQTRQQAPRPSQTRQEAPRGVEPPSRSPTSVPGSGSGRPQRTSVPPPVAPRPKPIPGLAQPRPASQRPKPQFKVQQVPAGRPVKRPASAAATAAAAAATPATKAAMAKRTSTKVLAREQMLSTREGVMLDRKTAAAAAASQEAHAKLTSAEHLQMILRQKDSLVQAIVLAEILGKPVGLRPKGSFELPL